MQIAIYIASFLMFSQPVAATECKSELLGLTVFLASGQKQWFITWDADGVHKRNADYYGNIKDRTNIQDSRGDKRADTLPHHLLKNNEQFNIPFDVSEKGTLLITTIYNREIVLPWSKKLAVVDLKNKKMLKIIETEYYVRSLGWAPGNQQFAVLYSKIVTDQVFKGPLDWLGQLLGHPVQYDTFYVAAYSAEGRLLCIGQVAEKLPTAEGYIDWEK